MMLKRLTLLMVLAAPLLFIGCSDDDSDGSDDANNGFVNNGQDEPDAQPLDLNQCQSGGGRLSDTQCNRFWDCNNTDFFDEEVPLFEVICSDDTCRCLIRNEELASFSFDDPTELCGLFGEPEFGQRIMQECNFPDGPESSDNPNNEDGNNDPPPPAREGFEDSPVPTCEDENLTLDARYFGDVASATILQAWTNSPLDDEIGDVPFVVAETHPIDTNDTSTPEQPSTDLSLTLQTDSVYRPGTESIPDCEGWNTQSTIVLRLEDAQGAPITCAIWGHDPDGMIDGQYTFGLGITDEDGQAVLEGCSFEMF